MPEEVRAQQIGPNGERLELKLGTRSVGVQAKDLISVLLLIAVIVLGYLRSKDLAAQLEHLTARQQQFQERQHAALAEAKDLHRATSDELKELLRTHETHMVAQTDTVRRLLLVHEANQHRAPEDRLPLELDPQRLSPSPR